MDSVVGVLALTGIGANGAASLRADVGGFGIGSDLAWQVVGSLAYRVLTNVDIVGAYRQLELGYESGRGAEQFRFDAAMSGPALGVTIHWR